jgi:hypothetical protein
VAGEERNTATIDFHQENAAAGAECTGGYAK